MAERFEALAISRNRIFASLWMLCGLAEGLAASDSVAILAARVQLDHFAAIASSLRSGCSADWLKA